MKIETIKKIADRVSIFSLLGVGITLFTPNWKLAIILTLVFIFASESSMYFSLQISPLSDVMNKIGDAVKMAKGDDLVVDLDNEARGERDYS